MDKLAGVILLKFKVAMEAWEVRVSRLWLEFSGSRLGCKDEPLIGLEMISLLLAKESVCDDLEVDLALDVVF